MVPNLQSQLGGVLEGGWERGHRHTTLSKQNINKHKYPTQLIRGLELNLHIRNKYKICLYITGKKITDHSEQKQFPSFGIRTAQLYAPCLNLTLIPYPPVVVIKVCVKDTKWP